jgi:hypothetical protein
MPAWDVERTVARSLLRSGETSLHTGAAKSPLAKTSPPRTSAHFCRGRIVRLRGDAQTELAGKELPAWDVARSVARSLLRSGETSLPAAPACSPLAKTPPSRPSLLASDCCARAERERRGLGTELGGKGVPAWDMERYEARSLLRSGETSLHTGAAQSPLAKPSPPRTSERKLL